MHEKTTKKTTYCLLFTVPHYVHYQAYNAHTMVLFRIIRNPQNIKLQKANSALIMVRLYFLLLENTLLLPHATPFAVWHTL